MSRPGAGMILIAGLLAGLPPLPEGFPIFEALPPEPRNRHQRRKAMAKARRANRGCHAK